MRAHVWTVARGIVSSTRGLAAFVHYGVRKAKRDLIVKLRAYPLKSCLCFFCQLSCSLSLSLHPPLFLPLSPWQVSHPHCGLWAAVAVQRAEIRAVRRQAHILYEVRAPPAQHSAALYICVRTSVYVCVCDRRLLPVSTPMRTEPAVARRRCVCVCAATKTDLRNSAAF